MAKTTGRKAGWGRDVGMVTGHRTKHPGLAQPAQSHTPYEARGFHGDKGHNSKGSMHLAKHNKGSGEYEGNHNSVKSNNPLPEAYHSNSGTSCEGHCLVERGGSIIHSGKVRGY